MPLRRLALVAALATLALTAVTVPAPAATQPPQPGSGPGGSDYAHAGVRVSSGGSGPDAWYVFEPTRPRPVSAPLAVLTHGYYQFTGYASMAALIQHTVRAGNVVIYPRWQTGVIQPCPGPFNVEPCMDSEVRGIRGALAYLHARRAERVQPQLERTSYFGFSFGGIITANLANRYRRLGMPRPRAIFLDDPHDGGLNGTDEPALDDSLAGIPRDALVQCHSGAQGVISEPSKADGSCNRVFPRLTSVPARDKDLVLVSPDTHGEPGLSAFHGVCAGAAGDAYDWGFCWKVWDALRSCAYVKLNCRWALGNTPEHRYLGTWSDGVPIVGLKVQDAAPIRPQPTPRRQAAPKTRPATDRPPRVKRVELIAGRDGRPVTLRGIAADDHGVASVEVGIARAGRSPATYRRARGTTHWSLRLPAGVPKGSRAFVLVTDSAGRQPARLTVRSLG